MDNFVAGFEKALEIDPELDSLLGFYGFEIDESTNAVMLDWYLSEYNWDDGFAVPYLITSHPNCELATAVNAFWLAEGYAYFADSFWSESKGTEAQWKEFVVFITENILGGAYKKGGLPYPKRWAQELSMDIEKKRADESCDSIDPVFYGLGKFWD